MPFVAQDPDSGVAISTSDIGDEYNYREDFECPFCGDELRYRRASKAEDGSTKRRGHFWHTEGVGGDGEAGGCSKVGESPMHEKWKEACGAMMAERYDTNDFYIEHQIGSRVADAMVELDGGTDKRGIVAEYQRNNTNKDYLDVTKHYLKFGYAVHWVFHTSEGYDMFFDAKNAFDPYCGSVYLGRGPELGSDGFIELGTQLWFDSFYWVVEKPSDLNPFMYDNELGFHVSGDYRLNFNNGADKDIMVYTPHGEQYSDGSVLVEPVSDWNDVLALDFTDSSGGGALAAYPETVRNNRLHLRRPLIRPPHLP